MAAHYEPEDAVEVGSNIAVAGVKAYKAQMKGDRLEMVKHASMCTALLCEDRAANLRRIAKLIREVIDACGQFSDIIEAIEEAANRTEQRAYKFRMQLFDDSN